MGQSRDEDLSHTRGSIVTIGRASGIKDLAGELLLDQSGAVTAQCQQSASSAADANLPIRLGRAGHAAFARCQRAHRMSDQDSLGDLHPATTRRTPETGSARGDSHSRAHPVIAQGRKGIMHPRRP